MKVRAARITTSTVPVAARNAQRSWSARKLVFLVVESESGASGVGEASPLEGYSLESYVRVLAELERAAERLPGTALGTRAKPALRRAIAASGVRSPSAVFAVETAVLDALGRELDQPAWRLLGGRPRSSPVAVSGLLTAAEPAELREQTREAESRGMRTVKLKVGPDLDRDLPRLKAVRRASSVLAIRLDANQSSEPRAFEGWARKLSPLRIELVEEPVPTRAWKRLARSPLPLAMDESLMSRGWQDRARAREDLEALVLKPMALGGFLRCLDLAKFARRHGISTYVTHLFDGPVAAAAAADLALALPEAPLPCGLDLHGRSDTWHAHRIARLGTASITPTPDAGIGVEIDVDAWTV